MTFGTVLTKSLVLVGAAATIVGCAKANEIANSVGGQTDKAVKELAIKNKWGTSCLKAATLAEIFGLPSQTETYDIGASLSKTTVLFGESNCAQPAITIVENGSYVLGDKVSDNVYALTETFNSVAITPSNQEGVNKLNAVKACGYSDWAVGQSKDVTAQSSTTPAIARCWIKTPRQIFDIAMITGDQLKLGMEKDGRNKASADKRPIEIDQAVVFTKK